MWLGSSLTYTSSMMSHYWVLFPNASNIYSLVQCSHEVWFNVGVKYSTAIKRGTKEKLRKKEL